MGSKENIDEIESKMKDNSNCSKEENEQGTSISQILNNEDQLKKSLDTPPFFNIRAQPTTSLISLNAKTQSSSHTPSLECNNLEDSSPSNQDAAIKRNKNNDDISLSRPLSALTLLSNQLPYAYRSPLSRTQSLIDGHPGLNENDINDTINDFRPRRSSSRFSKRSFKALWQQKLRKNLDLEDNEEERSFSEDGLNLKNKFRESIDFATESRRYTQSSLESYNFDHSDNLVKNVDENEVDELEEPFSWKEFDDKEQQRQQQEEEEKREDLVNNSEANLNKEDVSELEEEDTAWSNGIFKEEGLLDGSAHRRKFGNEDVTSKSWLRHQHHLFILSSAGKPIYTRYGDESKISTLMGIIQAIISFFVDEGDSIRSIHSNSHKILFLIRDPIYLVLVSRYNEHEDILRHHLYTMHSQLISTLTQSAITKAFNKSSNFDLRRLMGGTEGFMDALIYRITQINYGYLLDGVRAIRMAPELRKEIEKALRAYRPAPVKKDSNHTEILYQLLISGFRIIHLLRSQQVHLKPSDLTLLLNLVNSARGFQIKNQMNWVPICLPQFNKDGFLYVLISFISLEPPLALVFITRSNQLYQEVAEARSKVVKALEGPLLDKIYKSIQEDPYDIDELNLPGLRHFAFKHKALHQFTTAHIPFSAREIKKYFESYQILRQRLTHRFRKVRILLVETGHETHLAWHTDQFELYATLSPYIQRTTLVQMGLKVAKWVTSKKDTLFITGAQLL